jgi:hypothetical protein
LDDEGSPLGDEQSELTSPSSYYAPYEPSCGYCAGVFDAWSTEWVLRGGGTGSTCAVQTPYLCFDDARFSNVWPRADGSSIALGSFNGKLEIGADTHQSGKAVHLYPPGSSMNNAFLAKVSASGQALWSRSFVGSDNTWTYGLAEDSSGNIYLTGTFADPLTFGSTTLQTKGSVDIFVVKLDSNGNPIWAVSGGSKVYDYSSDLLLSEGKVYIVGTTQEGSQYGSITLPGYGAGDAFVATLDQNTGEWLWAESAGGPGADVARAIAKASDGSLIIGGSFEGAVDMFGQAVVSEGESDGFVAKLSETSGLTWLRVLGGAGEASIDSVATNSSSGILVGGWGTGVMTLGSTTATSAGEDDGFVAGLGESGSVHFRRTFGGTGSDRTRGVALDSSGHVFLTGYFAETAHFGADSLTSAGESDVVVAEIKNGQWAALMQGGGPGSDSPRRLSNLGKDKLWVTGRVLPGEADFGGEAASVDGFGDAFLWRLKRTECDRDYYR